jgi:hypothetical protein
MTVSTAPRHVAKVLLMFNNSRSLAANSVQREGNMNSGGNVRFSRSPQAMSARKMLTGALAVKLDNPRVT